MIELSDKTAGRVSTIFPKNQWREVEDLLKNECGENIPFCENSDKYEMERIRFAVIKLSEGNIEKLVQSIELAQTDWRDLLMMAGFGEDVEAHDKWKP